MTPLASLFRPRPFHSSVATCPVDKDNKKRTDPVNPSPPTSSTTTELGQVPQEGESQVHPPTDANMQSNTSTSPWDISKVSTEDATVPDESFQGLKVYPPTVRHPDEDDCSFPQELQQATDKEPHANAQDNTFERNMIEVYPGMHVPMRGCEETLQALRKGQVVNITCLDCTTKLYCIQDAEHVLCPLCRSISPNCFRIGKDSGGVGLGFSHFNTTDLVEETCSAVDSEKNTDDSFYGHELV